MDKKHTKGVILMTALVPTVGHEYLVKFAKQFCDKLIVIISVRSHEPTTFNQRRVAFPCTNVLCHEDDNAPQNPNTIEEWQYWKNIVDTMAGQIDYFFASEPYGQTMANLLGAEFIPVDINREIFPVKGSDIRTNLFAKQHLISAPVRKRLQTSVVVFGAESTGKTTLGKVIGEQFNARVYHEWARPYLETVGAEATEHRLMNIVKGQSALERFSDYDSDTLIKVFDTDLFTTLGFYRSHNIPIPSELYHELKAVRYKYNRLYILMNDSIDFESDPLRYGVTQRETDKKYWKDILEEFRLPYYELKTTTKLERLIEVSKLIVDNHPYDYFFGNNASYREIMDFERE